MTRANVARHLLSLACAMLVPTANAAIAPSELVAPKFKIAGGNLNFTVSPSLLGRNYQLQVSDTMASGSWTNVGVVRSGDGGNLIISHPYESGVQRRYYRVALVEAAPAPAGFSLISAGLFEMGQTDITTPVHSVYVSRFYMGRTEVTWLEWKTVRDWARASNLGYTDLADGSGKADNHPVHSISWYQILKWCNAKSEKEGLSSCYSVKGSVYRTTDSDAVVCNWSANGYRLPTEAEWEKAALGGVSGALFPWRTNTITHSQANYYSSSLYSYDLSPTRGFHPSYAVNGVPYTSPVGNFSGNGYGLYDMAGNVSEWCWDRHGTYAAGPQTDPRGPVFGSDRIIRGGCWDDGPYASYCAMRDVGSWPYRAYTFYGFRLTRSSSP